MHINIHIHIYIYTCTYVDVCMHARMHVLMYHRYVCVCVYTYIHIYKRTLRLPHRSPCMHAVYVFSSKAYSLHHEHMGSLYSDCMVDEIMGTQSLSS